MKDSRVSYTSPKSFSLGDLVHFWDYVIIIYTKPSSLRYLNSLDYNIITRINLGLNMTSSYNIAWSISNQYEWIITTSIIYHILSQQCPLGNTIIIMTCRHARCDANNTQTIQIIYCLSAKFQPRFYSNMSFFQCINNNISFTIHWSPYK